MTARAREAEVVVVGAGPAGLMLALHLGRAGFEVCVLEAEKVTSRHFRGESMVPDSVWMLRQAGLLEALEAQGVRRSRRLEIREGGTPLVQVDFTEFGDRTEPYPMEIPQNMLLDAMDQVLADLPSVTVLRGAPVTGLLRTGGRVDGVEATSADGPLTRVKARLVVAADGRYSRVRDMAGIEYDKRPLGRDVLWMSVPHPEGWERDTYRILIHEDQHVIALPTHPDRLRVGLNIPKGGASQLRAAGIASLHRRIGNLSPDLGATVAQHVWDWTDTSLLDIFTTRLPKWSDAGVVLIGDAAHTLSPVLGHGVNHAMQDAVMLADLVQDASRDGRLTADDEALDALLTEFQRVRERSVEASRSLQLRQERLFSLRGRRAVLRRNLYRAMGRIRPLRSVILGRAYFTLVQS